MSSIFWSPDHLPPLLDMLASATEILVATGSTSGGPVLDALVGKADTSRILVVTGCRDGMTRLDAVMALHRAGAEVRVVDDRYAKRFHAKIYAGRLPGGQVVAFVGSANLSGAAFGRNTELLARHDLDDVEWADLQARLLQAGPLLTDWDELTPPQDRQQHPLGRRVPLNRVLSMTWTEYLQALRMMNGWWHRRWGRRDPVFGESYGWINTLEELARVPVVPLDTMHPALRKVLAGTYASKEVGFFGGLKPAKAKQAFHHPSEPGWMDVATAIHDARASAGAVGDPITLDGAMAPIHDLLAMHHVALGIASRVLLAVRPDVYVSVNSQSRGRLSPLVAAPLQGRRSADGYRELLQRVYRAPWYQEPCPRDEAEAEVWRGRVALLDVFAYEDSR